MEEEKATEKQVKWYGSKIEGLADMSKGDAREAIDKLMQNRERETKPESKTEPVDAEVVNFSSKTETKGNGFHLTPEQCRSNALASAIEWGTKTDNVKNGTAGMMSLARAFEKYITTGESDEN